LAPPGRPAVTRKAGRRDTRATAGKPQRREQNCGVALIIASRRYLLLTTACLRQLASVVREHKSVTFGAHQREICPETLRTAEISSARQVACRWQRSRPGGPGTRSGPQTDKEF
jgi:hypothetical protein